MVGLGALVEPGLFPADHPGPRRPRKYKVSAFMVFMVNVPFLDGYLMVYPMFRPKHKIFSDDTKQIRLTSSGFPLDSGHKLLPIVRPSRRRPF